MNNTNTIVNEAKNLHNNINGWYKDINDFEVFKDYEYYSGGVLESLNSDDFGIQLIRKGTQQVIVFEKIKSINNEASYKLLDTVIVDNLKEDEYIAYQLCRLDSINDSEIIAIVKSDTSEYYNKLIKAWRADRKKGKIIEIKNVSLIDCYNESYGLSDCGE